MDLTYVDNAIEKALGNPVFFADASVNVCSAHIHIPIKNQQNKQLSQLTTTRLRSTPLVPRSLGLNRP